MRIDIATAMIIFKQEKTLCIKGSDYCIISCVGESLVIKLIVVYKIFDKPY
jgi:hypothetical protein